MSDSNKKLQLGNYQILEKIGTGGERYVFKAVCLAEEHGVKEGELVALNCLRDRESKVFEREAEILNSLTHPNIIDYKHSFVVQDHFGELFCLVMELLEGKTLKALLDESPQGIPWAEAKAIVRQILDALQYASEHHVVHRDLKPSNIFITNQQVVKLIDFGIARRHRDDDLTASTTGVKGSFDYMAPDFARAGTENFHGDETSDVFSFGVMLYQVLTGKLPLEALGGSEAKYRNRWMSAQLPEIRYPHPVFRVLPPARECVRKCLALDRKRRIANFSAVAEEFGKVQPFKVEHNGSTYEFVELLGKGGFGEVFRALHYKGDGCRVTSDGERTPADVSSPVTHPPSPVTLIGNVAVKRLLQSSYSQRFVREARILSEHPHPNLVRYLDFIEVPEALGPLYFLILEFLPGMPAATLRERVRKSESGLDPVEVLSLFTGYLDCLHHLHQQGIVHRDLKPGNLYAPEGAPANGKIFDLGIAHDEEGTRTHGQVPGTLDYMPPEFATQDKGRGSAQSDIFALGVTLYQALTKSLPFPRLPEKETEAWMAFFERSQRPLECSFDHSVFNQYPELMPLLRRALASEPSRRHENAGQMRDDIQEILLLWQTKEPYEQAVAAALAALSEGGYEHAETEAQAALALRPRDQAAKDLLTQAQEGQRNRLYAKAVAAVRSALTAFDYSDAERQAQEALRLKPADPAATQLLTQARQAMRRYETAVAEAETALGRGDFARAEQQAKQALALKPADQAATALSLRAQEAKQKKCQYDAAMVAGAAALRNDAFDEARDQAQRSLELMPGDQAAQQLLSRIAAAREVQTEYDQVVQFARNALHQRDYPEAEKHARHAVRLKQHDPVGRQLLADARQGRKAQVSFDTAIFNAREALESGNYELAEKQITRALALRPEALSAQELMAEVKEGRRREQSCNEISEWPTDRFTMATLAFSGATSEGATAATLPANLAQALQVESQKPHAESCEPVSRPEEQPHADAGASLPGEIVEPVLHPEQHGIAKLIDVVEEDHAAPGRLRGQAGRRKALKWLLAAAAITILAVTSSLLVNKLKSNFELAKLNTIKQFTLQPGNFSPEFFPLAEWNVFLSQAETKAQSQGRYARRWAELSAQLLVIGREFPEAHAAAFRRAFDQRDLAAAERLFNQWKQAQPLLSRVEFSGDYRLLRNEMERDLGRIRAARRDPTEILGPKSEIRIPTEIRAANPETNARAQVANSTEVPATNHHVQSISAPSNTIPMAVVRPESQVAPISNAVASNQHLVMVSQASQSNTPPLSITLSNLPIASSSAVQLAKSNAPTGHNAFPSNKVVPSFAKPSSQTETSNKLESSTRIRQALPLQISSSNTVPGTIPVARLPVTGSNNPQPSNPQNGPITLLGIEFLWVAGVGSNGAYVAATELSQGQFKCLTYRNPAEMSKMKPRPATDVTLGEDKPMNLTFEEARSLCADLNRIAAGHGLPVIGHFALPTRSDFLVYAGLSESEASTQTTAGRSFSVAPAWRGSRCGSPMALARHNPAFTNIFARAELQGAIINGKSPPVSVKSGKPNKLGLYHVLGNAWEWCLSSKDGAIGVPAGFSFFSTGFGRSKDLFAEWGDWSQELTGLRLVFVPEGNYYPFDQLAAGH